MFSLLNILNYYTGKCMSKGLLILIAIVIYCIVFRQMHNEIMNNTAYMITITILMVTDLVTIFMLFSEAKEEEEKVKVENEGVAVKKTKSSALKIKGSEKKKGCNKKESTTKKTVEPVKEKDDVKEVGKRSNPPTGNESLIDVYDENELSVHTYE